MSKSHIPQLVIGKIYDDEWKVVYYEEFRGVLEKDPMDFGKDWTKLGKISFREQVSIQSLPFLVGFFPEEKTLRLYSPRLHRELFLLENIEGNDFYKEERESESYQEFKKHVESVASLASGSFPSVFEQMATTYQLNERFDDNVEQRSDELVRQLMVFLHEYRASLFEKFSDHCLSLTAQYALLRVHLLKFLAILPSLDHDLTGAEVKRMLCESLRRLLADSKEAKRMKKKGDGRPLPTSFIFAFSLSYQLIQLIPAKVLAFFVRFSVRLMAKRFIAGESIELAEQSLRQLQKTSRDVTLDQLGELVVSEKEANHYQEQVIKLVKGFELHVPRGERNSAGILKAHVSIKVSALCSDFKPEAFEYTYQHVAPRLRSILLAGKEESVFINIDAEHFHYRDCVLKIYRKVLLETESLKDYGDTGIVVQAYLRDGASHLEDVVDLAREREMTMPVRLVKGAYWDAETVEADAHSYNAPEFLNKEETDLNFRGMVDKIFKSHPHLKICLASHNFSDHCFAEALRETQYPEIDPIEHQCLHMTYEALSTAMAKMNWAVRNYVPVGSLLVGMAYLVRRIMENSSQVGVLTIMRSHKKQKNMLLASSIHRERKNNGELARDITCEDMTKKFFNVTPARLYLDSEKKWVDLSLEKFKRDDLGKEFVNSFPCSGEERDILCSSDPSIVVGRLKKATEKDAEEAISRAQKCWLESDWGKKNWVSRSSLLIKVADLMLARRNELSALICYEAGKSVNEALADVDEAVDFLNFYAREEGRHQKHSHNSGARGLTVAITPWNFPLAIPTGMISAPLVAGNPVILKPAEQTPLITQVLVDLFHEAGLEKDLLIHLPGPGRTVGEFLVNAKEVASIVFTGSKAVGTGIASKASRRLYDNPLTNQRYPVKVITEMGGKNAIIVTTNAELDETVAGILYSAFGHSGQKCSAASRVLVDNAIKDKLIERLREACHDIQVGAAWDFSTTLNPIVCERERDRLRREVVLASEQAKSWGGKVHIDRTAEDLPGFCIGPALIELPANKGLHPESYSVKELFGPVIHLIGFDTLDQALEIFNGTDYGLTGGVFSQSQDDIDYLMSKMECGNIYINRSITGARVGIEPFGGFKLSGTGPKAGHRSYVPVFHHHQIDNFLEEKDLPEGEGSAYQFDLARPSLLKVSSRIHRISRGLNSIIKNFESLFPKVYGGQKDILKSYQKWVMKNGESFQVKNHFNRKIPGQLGHNNFSMVQEHAVILSFRECPDFSVFMQFLSGLTMGTGMTVLARSEKSYGFWMRVRDIFVNEGISKENFDVYFCDENQLSKVIENPMVSTFIVDGSLDRLERLLPIIYNSIGGALRMRSVLQPWDAPELTDFKRLCGHYLWVRSFAINIMRHGAPLELQ